MRDLSISMPERVPIKITNAEYYLKLALKELFREKYRWLKGYGDIVDWLTDNQGKGLLMMGNCGLGKTVIAGHVIPALVRNFNHRIINTFDATEVNTMIDEVKKKYLVSIDDVGTEGIASIYGERRQAIPEIVDNAEKTGHLLLMTTNLNVEQLQEKYGVRTIDRLRAITKQVILTGPSLRG